MVNTFSATATRRKPSGEETKSVDNLKLGAWILIWLGLGKLPLKPYEAGTNSAPGGAGPVVQRRDAASAESLLEIHLQHFAGLRQSHGLRKACDLGRDGNVGPHGEPMV